MPRSIGSVVVSVDANTRRLKATMVKDGTEAGKATAKAIQTELSGIEVEIAKIDGSKEARLLKAQLEHALRDTEVSLDFTDARASLREFEQQAEAVRLVLNTDVELSEEDLAAIRADYGAWKEEIERDKIVAKLTLEANTAVEQAIAAEAALEDVGVTWRVDLDGLDKALSEADAAKFAMEKDKVKLQIDTAGSLVKAMGEVEAAKRAIEKDEVRWNMNFATALGEGEAAVKLFLAKERNIKLGMDADVAGMAAALEVELLAIEAELPNIDVEIEAMVNSLDLAAQMAKIRALVGVEDFEANVQVRIDKASKAKADALLKNNMKETGKQSGAGFGGSLLTGDNTKLFILAGLSMGDALASGLSGGVAAATSIISSAIQALGGAAGAAAPVVAGLGVSLGAVIVGSKGVGDAIKEVNKEFATAAKEGRDVNLANEDVLASLQNLAPSARATAEAFAGIKGELTGVRLDVQQHLFSGFSGVLTDLGKTVLPDVGEGLDQAADSVNRFGKQLAGVAKETDFSQIGKDLKPALDDAFDGATALAGVLGPFLQAAAKPAERLAEMFERGAESMRDWVRANPATITGFLNDGLDSLKDWVELLKSTGDLLGTLFSAGAASGDTFVVGLNNIIERWDAWMEDAANDDAIAGFFASGHEAMIALQPVLDGLKEAFDILITDDTMTNFENLASAIGDALPALADLIQLIGELQLAAGFANLLAALQPVFELFQKIPAEFLEVAGVAIAVSLSLMKIVAALEAIGIVSAGLTLTNPVLLAIAAAVTAVVVVVDLLSSKADKAAASTKELSHALENNVDAAINAGDALSAAAVGADELNNTLFNTGDIGKNIQEGFKFINAGAGDATLGIEDTTAVLTGLKKEAEGSIPTLQKLAEGYGLPADAAAELGAIVAATDDNMAEAHATGTNLGHDMTDLAKKFGLPRDELVKLFGALETLQDQAENTGLDKMQQDFLDSVGVMGEAEQAVLAHATAMQKNGEIAAGVGPLYEAVVEGLFDLTNASDGAAEGALGLLDSTELVNQAIQDGLAAHQLQVDALKKERDAAFDAWETERDLAEETEHIAVAAAGALGFSEELAQRFVDIGDAARDAKDEADAFKSTMDLLIAPAGDVQAALSDIEEHFDDFWVAIQGGQEAIDKYTEAEEKRAKASEEGLDPEKAKQLNEEADAAEAAAKALGEAAATLDLHSKAGRENAAFIREQAAGLITFAEASLKAGDGQDEIAAKVAEVRESITQQADAFGLSREEAEAYVTELLGAPEFMTTLIQTPGLIEALTNAADLNVLYDDAGQPVVTEFEALGLDPALADSQEFKDLLIGIGFIEASPTIDDSGMVVAAATVDGVNAGLADVDGSNVTATVNVEGVDPEDPLGWKKIAAGLAEQEVVNLIGGVQGSMDTLNETVAEPAITPPPSAAELQGQVDGIQTSLEDLNNTVAAPSVTIPFIDTNITRVGQLQTAIDKLTGKTVTITVNTVASGAAAGIDLGTLTGAMAGEMITAPTIRRVGERSRREAIVPLDLPLSRVDPSVRELAALIRGDIKMPVAPGKTVNNYMTITPAAADPRAVATQVVNRAAALASR